MNKLKFFFIALLVGLIFCACSSEKDNQDKSSEDPVSAKEVISAIDKKLKELSNDDYVFIDLKNPEEVEFFFPMKNLNLENIKDGYAIQGKRVTQAALIIVVEGTDAQAANELEEAMNRVLSEQVSIWSEYIPDQYDDVKNNTVEREGNFLAYITSKHVDDLKEAFENHVK